MPKEQLIPLILKEQAGKYKVQLLHICWNLTFVNDTSDISQGYLHGYLDTCPAEEN
jgi:hypothetical protein